MLLSVLTTNLSQAMTCPKTSSRKANSVPSKQRRSRPTEPRSETPAKPIWTYVYNHDVDKGICRSGFHEQCRIFPSSFTLPLCLATDADLTDRRMAMHTTYPSADPPTARMHPTAASLDRIRRFSIILIRIAISKVKAFCPVATLARRADLLRCSIRFRCQRRDLHVACATSSTKKTRKGQKRALEAKVCVAFCILCSSLTTSLRRCSRQT